MRVVFLILLMVLTPLRGWTNDVMATRMASPLPAASQAAVTEAHTHCEEMAAADAQAAPASPAQKSLHCDNCSFCQMCFAVAMPVTLALAPQLAGHHTPPALQEEPFRSAALSLGHKPPIF
jgi:MinD superfamily P-loop ATPase